MPSAAQPQTHMPSAAYLTDPVDSEIFHDQCGLWTAVAAGFQTVQRIDVVQGQQLRRHHAVGIQHGSGGVLGIVFLGFLADGLPKVSDFRGMNGKARCQLVTAVALQQVGQLRQGAE